MARMTTRVLWPVGMALAGIAHDMRSPLCAITLYNDLLRDTATESQERNAFHRGIEAQVQRLVGLVAALAGHAQEQEVGLRRERINLRTLLKDTTELHATLLAAQGYEVVLDAPSVLPHILADREALTRVLANLLDNAVKFSTPHRITLRVRVHGSRPTYAWTVLEVVDRGPGIPQEHRSRIFDPKYRAGHPASGSGLGLAIARALVQAHHGDIAAGDTPGGGTTIRIRLPADTDGRRTASTQNGELQWQ